MKITWNETGTVCTDVYGNTATLERWAGWAAAVASLESNTGCTSCRDCSDCINCADCTNCTDCACCTNVHGCTCCHNCTDCTDCTDCTNCTNCTDDHGRTGAGQAPEPDPVNHPAHYTQHPSGIEVIEITEHMGFCLGNAIKYILRAEHKGNFERDLRKSIWYIEREIARRGKE